MTHTIKNLFTRTQFILLASLLALVFLYTPSVQAATSNIDLSITPSDSSIEWIGEEGVTYSFYFDGSKTETKLKEGESIFATIGMKRGTFSMTPGAHTVTAVGKDKKGIEVATSPVTAFSLGTVKPTAGVPVDSKNITQNIYPFMAKAVSSTQIDLIFNCTVPNADHNCKIYQDGKLIKTFDVKTKDYGRYTTYSVKNLTPNTKYTFTVVEYAKKGSLPNKPTGNIYTYTPTLTLKTPSTADVVPPTTSSIKVISPNGGEQWDESVLNTVTWTPYSYGPDVNPAKDVTAYLEKKDGKGNFVTIGKVEESGKASIHWFAGELNSASRGGDYAKPGDGYYIRVVNNKTGATDRSDKPFTLLPKPIKMKVNGSENLVEIPTVKTPITVSWETSPGVTTCQLSGMKGVSFSTIQPSKGSVTGLIDYQKIDAKDGGGIWYGVRLQCVKNGTQITSNASFVVTSDPPAEASLRIISPNGGESYELNKQLVSEYNYEGLNSASFALYKNDKWLAWLSKDVNVSQSKNGTYSFVPSVAVPSLTTNEKVYKLYITGKRADGEGYIEDKSDAPFSFVDSRHTCLGLGCTAPTPTETIPDIQVTVTDTEAIHNTNGTNSNENDDDGEYTLKFTVDAIGGDVFLNKTAFLGTSTGNAGVSYLIEKKDGTLVTDATVSSAFSPLTNVREENGRYVIDEGESEDFELTVRYMPRASGQYRVVLYSLNYALTNAQPNARLYTTPKADYSTSYASFTRTTTSASTPTSIDKIPPTIPANLKATANSSSQVTLTWSPSIDNSGVALYRIKRGDKGMNTILAETTGTQFEDKEVLKPSTTYTYYVQALDIAKEANMSGYATVTVKTLAQTSTALPTCTLTANKSSYVLGETITYSWTSKNATYAGWQQDTSGKDHLLLPGDKLSANGTQAVVASVTGNPPVTLSVGGVGGTGSCSLTVAVTSPTPVVTTDKAVPSAPTSATVANPIAVAGSGWGADVSWGASTDNVGVTGYIVKRIAPTAATLTTTTGKTFKLTGLTVGGEYTVSIQAKDARGNLGPARVVKFKLNLASMATPPTIQIISNTVDTTVQKVVTQAPTPVPLSGAENTTNAATLTALLNKLIELKAMMASVKAGR